MDCPQKCLDSSPGDGGRSRNSCLSTCRSHSEAGPEIRVGHDIGVLNLAAQVGDGRHSPYSVLQKMLKILGMPLRGAVGGVEQAQNALETLQLW